MKRIAVLTFEGYNELDSFIAFAMLNRVRNPKLTASIVCPGERATSMNGLVAESLGSHYLAAWVIGRLAGWKAAEAVVHYVAPVGQKDEYVRRAHAAVGNYL